MPDYKISPALSKFHQVGTDAFGGSPTPAVSPQPTPAVPPSGGPPAGSSWLDALKNIVGPVGTEANYQKPINKATRK